MRALLCRGLIVLFVGMATVCVLAADAPAVPVGGQGDACACMPDPPVPATMTLEEAHRGLSRGPLRQARLEGMPEGLLLRTVNIDITEKQLAVEIAKASPAMLPVLKKNGFFLLEQIAMRQLLTAEARDWAKTSKRDTKTDTDSTLLQAYLTSRAQAVTVTDAQVRAFYEANADMVGNASYATVAKDIKAYLLAEKQQAAIDAHINALSARTPIEVNREWVNAQAAVMLQNPVDAARRSGKPSVIDFGRGGCGPCDMMTPILDELRERYAGKCHVLFCHVGDEPILAARYNIQSIPVQIFFNKDGMEVFRHAGYFPKAQMLEQLAKLGVQ